MHQLESSFKSVKQIFPIYVHILIGFIALCKTFEIWLADIVLTEAALVRIMFHCLPALLILEFNRIRVFNHKYQKIGIRTEYKLKERKKRSLFEHCLMKLMKLILTPQSIPVYFTAAKPNSSRIPSAILKITPSAICSNLKGC